LTELGDKARALVEAGRVLDDPADADRARVRARLAATLGGSVALGAATKVSAAAAKSGGVWGSSAALGAKLLSPVVMAVALSSATAAVIWTQSGSQYAGQASQQPAVARLESPAKLPRARALPLPAAQPSAALPASAPTPLAAAVDASATPNALPSAQQPLVALRTREANMPRFGGTQPAAATRNPRQRNAAEGTATSVSRNPAVARKPAGAVAERAAVSVPELVTGIGPAEPPAHDAQPTVARAAVPTPSAAATPLPTAAAPAATRTAAATTALPPSAAAPTATAPIAVLPTAAPAAAASPQARVTSTHADALPPTAAQAPDLADELALLSAAQRAIRTRHYAQALTLLDEHAARHASGSLMPERLAARAVALCRSQRVSAGVSELRRLEARAPQSPLLPWVRTNCALPRSP
jgi:hypothetical protein